jgi:hypothetical protein
MCAEDGADAAKGGPSRLLSVFCPLLKAFSGGDAAAARPRWLEVRLLSIRRTSTAENLLALLHSQVES